MRPEWDVHSYRVSILYQPLLQVTTDAIQHLEFYSSLWQTNLLRILPGKFDAILVVCGNRRNRRETSIRADPRGFGSQGGVNQDLRQQIIVGVRVGFFGESFIGRLMRSEEHTSELQSPTNLVCRLL